MKKLNFTILLTVLLSMVGAKAFAHDIAVKNADGVTIYYVWANNNTELAVSYRGSSYTSNYFEYSGNVVIPESVTYNGATYCVTSIRNYAFRDCSGLTSVTISNSVTSIGIYAFSGCYDLTSVTIGNSVTSIGSDAFSGCYGLTSITIPNSVTYIGNAAFYCCRGLTSVTIPNSMTSIGREAFDGCSGLTSVTIPNSVTSIGVSAFSDCSGLTSVTIGSGVTSIGSSAFRGCSDLTSVISEIEIPFTFGGGAFSGISNNCTLTVPGGTKTAYIAAGWTESVFKGGIIEKDNQIAQTLALTSIPAMTYGDAAYTLPQETTEGLKLTWNVDNAAVASVSGNMLDIVGAGSATVTATQAGNDSYQPFLREFALTVNKATLTITADDKTKQEGEENPELTVSYTGFVNGDNATSLTTQPTVTTTANTTSPAGTYPITVSGAASNNYEFNYVNGTLMVNEKPAQPAVEVTDISQLDNVIYIEPFTVRVGGEANIEICLKNAGAATAYVFDMALPEGITVAKNDKGKFIDALSDRHDDHTRTFNDKGNNTYSLSTLSGNSEPLTGNDGAIRLLTLTVADDMAEGVYAVEIKNASYSKPDGTLVSLPNTTTSVTVENYVLGDVNGNDGVDIGDAVSIVNYLVGKESSVFVEKAADTNKNGQIDIGDAVTIVNFLVGKTESLSRQTTVWDEKEPQ